MSKVDANNVKKLRELTGAGMQDAHKALMESQGDMKKAEEFLRKKGAVKLAKKSERVAREGLIDCYSHSGRVGVLLEVNCETDFVAKTEDFKNFVHELSLQIAGASPTYIARTDVPKEVLEKEKEVFTEQVRAEGKPEAVAQKIIEGKLNKFFETECLLDQSSIKDPNIKISQLLTDAVSRLGENIVVARFIRYQLGEEK